MRWVLALTLLLAVACQDFDPADRRAATPDQYEVTSMCGANNDHVAANGTLINRSGEPNGFAVTVRFFDGEVDLGRPQTVNHVEPLAAGETWRWSLDFEAPHAPSDLNCAVIQVAIGDDVDH
jgi:hypothetical protein